MRVASVGMEPRLSDALDMLFGPQRFSAQHAAGILRVNVEALLAALAMLEAVKVIEVTDRGTPSEAWHATVGDGRLPALLERIAHLEGEGALHARVLETPLS